MQTLQKSFTAAGQSIVVSASPSGSRYAVTDLFCSNGSVTAQTYPSSGLYGTASNGNPLHNVNILPTGTIGDHESIELVVTSPCDVTLGYILVTPTDHYKYIPPLEQYSTKYASRQAWPSVVQSGSYKTGFGG